MPATVQSGLPGVAIPGLIEGLETAAADVDSSVRAAAQQALVNIRPVVNSEADVRK